MRIFVLGGAGYIGSHVARRFLDAGHSVRIFDNLSTGLRENIQCEAEFIEGDILSSESLKKAMAGGFDAVVHLAAFKNAGESMTAPEKYAATNIGGAIHILNAMAETGIRKLIFSSSSSVYGEPRYLPMDEAHPLEPVSLYGFTKLEMERLMAWYDKLRGIRFVALRYFNAAGYDPQGRILGLEKNPANLIPVVMEVAAGLREKVMIFGKDFGTPDGFGVRDYVHVADLAEGHLAALNYLFKMDSSLVANLGTERGFSVMEVIASAERITGRKIPYEIIGRRAGDPAKVYARAVLAGRTLGWNPRFRAIDAILETHWRAYRANYLG